MNFGRKTKDINRVSESKYVDTVRNSKRVSIDTDLSKLGTTVSEDSRISESACTEATGRGIILPINDESVETGTRDATKRLKDEEVSSLYTVESNISEGQISGVRIKRHDDAKSVKLPGQLKGSGSGWLGVAQKSVASDSQISQEVAQKSKKRQTEIFGETERSKSNDEETGVDVFADSKSVEKQPVSSKEVTMLPHGFRNAKIKKVIVFVMCRDLLLSFLKF